MEPRKRSTRQWRWADDRGGQDERGKGVVQTGSTSFRRRRDGAVAQFERPKVLGVSCRFSVSRVVKAVQRLSDELFGVYRSDTRG